MIQKRFFFYLDFLARTFTIHSPAAQSAITCSKLAIETLEQGVKYVQN